MKDSIVIIRIKLLIESNSSLFVENNLYKYDYLHYENALLISSLAKYVIILDSGKGQIQYDSYCIRNLCLNIKSKIVVAATAGIMNLYRPFFEMVNIGEKTPW